MGDLLSAADEVPELPAAALHGPLGEYVLEASEHTEADPAALLVSAIVCCGVVAGPGRFMMAGNRPQRARVFALFAADSPKAHRGLS